mgnify:CR=1 FL=1
MKKLKFVLGVLVINFLLINIIYKLFNPYNLNLSELEWFNGFAWTQLFPNNGLATVLIYGSIIGLIFINTLFVKLFKGKLIV